MELKEFDYLLPEELIATVPSKERSSARLLSLDKKSGAIKDRHFYDLPKMLKEGDVLVFNDSKVIPARLEGESCGRKFEVLLVKKIGEEIWECWLRPGRRAKIGNEFIFGEGLKATLVRREENIFIMDFNKTGLNFVKSVERIGQVPLPPYILKQRQKEHQFSYKKSDQKNYQTIYAKAPGSVAAPTAGLHFDRQILERLAKNGVQTEKVTLHVSLGTFQPIKTEKIEDFDIHSEYLEVTKKTAQNLNKAKAEGRRIIAVGTTSVRVLESAAVCHCEKPEVTKQSGSLHFARDDKYTVQPITGETKIYIYPGYQFKFVDGIITNFHLPKSSLLLLVSAFAGKNEIKKAYEHAIKEKYKFYSYGDGMIIL
jgi:S-adenosylmethionine:tRNA ribosyltransferase-isomerase